MIDITNTHLLPLSSHLRRYTFTFRDELDFHGLLETAMLEGGWHVEREVILGAKDRIDFVVQRKADGILDKVRVGVEVKVKASPVQVERQLRRYALHPSIDGILVVSSSVQLARLPKTIGPMPIHVVVLGTTL
jgi:hypothetical protein